LDAEAATASGGTSAGAPVGDDRVQHD